MVKEPYSLLQLPHGALHHIHHRHHHCALASTLVLLLPMTQEPYVANGSHHRRRACTTTQNSINHSPTFPHNKKKKIIFTNCWKAQKARFAHLHVTLHSRFSSTKSSALWGSRWGSLPFPLQEHASTSTLQLSVVAVRLGFSHHHTNQTHLHTPPSLTHSLTFPLRSMTQPNPQGREAQQSPSSSFSSNGMKLIVPLQGVVLGRRGLLLGTLVPCTLFYFLQQHSRLHDEEGIGRRRDCVFEKESVTVLFFRKEERGIALGRRGRRHALGRGKRHWKEKSPKRGDRGIQIQNCISLKTVFFFLETMFE